MARFLDALHGKNKGRPPVWIMRQAGRYLPEYRKMRAAHSFLDMVRNPEIAAEVTQLPLRRYPLDAAILFSDILVISEALGCPVEFHEGVGPVFPEPIRSVRQVEEMQADLSSISYVFDAVRVLLPDLQVPLLGFAGAPFTVASYMTGGKKEAKLWMLRDPATFHNLLDKITAATVGYLLEQAVAGVAAVQLFESWASELSYPQFEEFSAPYLTKIVSAVSKKVPVIVFGRGMGGFIDPLQKIGAQGLSLDWGVSLSNVRKQVGPKLVLQGNLDPHTLYSDSATIEQETKKMLKEMKGDPAYIANLGHGVFPDVSPEAVGAFIEAVCDTK